MTDMHRRVRHPEGRGGGAGLDEWPQGKETDKGAAETDAGNVPERRADDGYTLPARGLEGLQTS